MKKSLLAASVAALFLSATAASAVEVGVDSGLVQVGASPMSTATRVYVTLPVLASADGKKSMGWENSAYLLGNQNYRAVTSEFVFDLKSNSGLIFEGRFGAAKVSSTIESFSTSSLMIPGSGLQTTSAVSLAYGVGVRYVVQDVTLRATVDSIGKLRNATGNFNDPVGANVSAHVFTVGVGYAF